MKKIGIYKITSPSGRIYIGQSINIDKRISRYKILKDCEKQVRLYASFLKHGVENHKFEIITECNEKELNNLERYYQDLYDACGKMGMNCSLTKSDNRSGSFNESTRKNMSEGQKKLYKNGYVSPSKGKKASEEHRQKLIENHWSKKEGYVNPNKGKVIGKSPENAIKVINLQNGFIYDSVQLAWFAFGANIGYKSFARKLSGKRKNDTNFKYID